eukprot:GFYU01001007.1.p1 GENE.GFYU01001007.1~~GFYU01001007.1.p1  ORF type:complete len:245 (-),score=48.60 GFYU01001007.1:192-926(-)
MNFSFLRSTPMAVSGVLTAATRRGLSSCSSVAAVNAFARPTVASTALKRSAFKSTPMWSAVGLGSGLRPVAPKLGAIRAFSSTSARRVTKVPLVAALSIAGGVFMSTAGAAACEAGSSDSNIPGMGDFDAGEWLKKNFPSDQFGFGTVCGLLTGVVLKEIGRRAAFALGIGFLTLQGLSYMGYIDVKWSKVEKDLKDVVDKDGDGNIDASELKDAFNRFCDAMKANLPSSAGFSTGLMLGVKYG